MSEAYPGTLRVVAGMKRATLNAYVVRQLVRIARQMGLVNVSDDELTALLRISIVSNQPPRAPMGETTK